MKFISFVLSQLSKLIRVVALQTTQHWRGQQTKSWAIILFFSSIVISSNISTLAVSPPPDWANAVTTAEQKWEKQYEDYFEQNLGEVTLNAQDIAEVLRQIHAQTGKKPAVIWAMPRSDSLELVLVTPDRSATGVLLQNVNAESLQRTSVNFYQETTNPRKIQSQSYLPAAQQLYQWMIQPLESTLQAEKIDTLLFCLGEGLRTLPLAAFHDGQRFLIEKYSLTRIPAFNLMKTNYTQIRNAQVLAMGASEFREQEPLPAVPLELSAIVRSNSPTGLENGTNLGQWIGKSFLNETFTLDNLKAQLASKSFEIIHLATHAEFRPGAPGNSFIQFWNKQLNLDQMRDLKWEDSGVELLVLSACKTAVGDEDVELGFAGLAFQSGVKSALASLWYVSDAGTLALMSEFYQQLKTAPIKAEALRKAQIAMIRGQVRLQQGELLMSRGGVSLPPALANLGDETLSHPYYWAAFTFIGSPW